MHALRSASDALHNVHCMYVQPYHNHTHPYTHTSAEHASHRSMMSPIRHPPRGHAATPSQNYYSSSSFHHHHRPLRAPSIAERRARRRRSSRRSALEIFTRTCLAQHARTTHVALLEFHNNHNERSALASLLAQDATADVLHIRHLQVAAQGASQPGRRGRRQGRGTGCRVVGAVGRGRAQAGRAARRRHDCECVCIILTPVRRMRRRD